MKAPENVVVEYAIHLLIASCTMKHLIACAALALLLSSTCFGQSQPAVAARGAQPEPTPATKLETFQAKTGAVIIKGYTEMGSLRGTGGTVSVIAMEFTDAQTGRKEQGVVIEVKESGRLERESRSYIDYDEIDSLLKGIDYISKIEPAVSKLANFEAAYRTRGDFSVTTFSDATSGGISVAVTSGRIGRTSMYIKLAELPAFRNLITEAKAKLDAAR